MNYLSTPVILKSKTVWSAIGSLVAATLVVLMPELEVMEEQLVTLIAILGFGVVSRWALVDIIYVLVNKDYPEKYK